MEPIPSREDYLLTLYEVCEILGKSTRTVTRYVHRHILHPRGIKSRQGTLEYRFSRDEVLELKGHQDALGNYGGVAEPAQQVGPMASFANLAYPPAVKQQAPIIIPGISFPVAGGEAAPVQPQRRARKIEMENAPDEPVAKSDPVSPKASVAETAPAKIREAEVRGTGDGQIITLLKETTEMLRDQLNVKDAQIKNLDEKIGQLIERNRETNILLKGLQDKMVLLEKPKNKEHRQSERAESSPAGRMTATPEESPRPAPTPQAAQEEVFMSNAEVSATLNDLQDTQANLVPNPPASVDRSIPRTGTDRADAGTKKSLFGKFFG
ncbi:MAG: helix-turn-helix domain-containing protein [Candidatus Pacebacteria bacterium]|jgi:hypothetical protein|nr:helix-turn-helix domain-containing protein [Candidatus Paceibacterota bacterium]